MLCRSLLLVLLFLMTSPAFSQSKNPWPNSSPEEQGINSATLADAIKVAKHRGYESGDIDNIGLEAIQAYRNGEKSDSLLQNQIRDGLRAVYPQKPTAHGKLGYTPAF